MAIEVPFNLSGLAGEAGGVASSVIAPVASAFKAISNPLSLLGLTSNRSIGNFTPDVVTEESGNDVVVLTDHPVEKGSPITDHTFALPAEVRVRACWSDSGSGPGYVKQVYASVLALQAARQPITVNTGKRVYKNMVLSSVTQTTDVSSEYSLMLDLALRYVNIVTTVTVQLDASKASNPADTAPTQQSSPQQPVTPQPSQERSLLDRLFGSGAPAPSAPTAAAAATVST